MGQEITLTLKQKNWVARAALEYIKDAPVYSSEISEIARDALHLMTYGSQGLMLNKNIHAYRWLQSMPAEPQL